MGYTLGAALVGGGVYAAGSGVKKATSGTSGLVVLGVVGIIAFTMLKK